MMSGLLQLILCTKHTEVYHLLPQGIDTQSRPYKGCMVIMVDLCMATMHTHRQRNEVKFNEVFNPHSSGIMCIYSRILIKLGHPIYVNI